jgi:hypothetical protein
LFLTYSRSKKVLVIVAREGRRKKVLVIVKEGRRKKVLVIVARKGRSNKSKDVSN